jgi:Uma2 family endonuclease
VLDFEQLAGGRPRPLRRREYDKLVELGFFDDEAVELLYGFVVPMSPKGAPHDASIQWLTERLVPALAGRASVRIQSALIAGESEPEPDVAVVPPAAYRDRHPSEAWLIIEVAEPFLEKDRGAKAHRLGAQG